LKIQETNSFRLVYSVFQQR